jgi:hypothetical protein
LSADKPNKALLETVRSRADKGTMACAVAFAIAERLHAAPIDLGRALNLEDISIVKCQLGLFGYKPEKKIVRPMEKVPVELRKVITAGLADGRLPCAQVWAIAEKFNMSKMDISAACEKLEIKIKPCQLGAF